MSAVPGPTTDILATLVWDTWDSATYHWPSHWEGEKSKRKMQVQSQEVIFRAEV